MELTPLLARIATVAVVVVGALLAHYLLFQVAYRVALSGPTGRDLHEHVRWPARAVVALLAAALALPLAGFTDPPTRRVTHGFLVLLILALTWLLLRLVRVAERAAKRRFDIEVRDNLQARRKRTQAEVVSRVVSVVIGVVGFASVLLTFEEARAVGTSLLASAGVAGLVAGIAARTTLGNLIAGLQIAFTEPIRIDDVVVMEGEWGRIEEITLTYVVVALWDQRRLVLPTTYFVEQPFENWTRHQSQFLGAVHLFVDYTVPVEEVRAELERILHACERWDGDAWVLQVVGATEQTMELRALMTAEDAPTSWDLRCEVREALIAWLQDRHPGGLPRVRITSVEAAETLPSPHRPSRQQAEERSGGRQQGIADLGTLDPAEAGEAGGEPDGDGAESSGEPSPAERSSGASGARGARDRGR